MLRTVQVDVSDTALNHHRYGLSRILSDGGKASVLAAGKKQKSTAAVNGVLMKQATECLR